MGRRAPWMSAYRWPLQFFLGVAFWNLVGAGVFGFLINPLLVAFWGMNVGLGLMIGLRLLPIGLMQTVANVDHGLWYARSADFLQQPLLENLRWLRIVGDTVFLVGVGSFAWFMLGLKTGWSYVKPATTLETETNAAGAAE